MTWLDHVNKEGVTISGLSHSLVTSDVFVASFDQSTHFRFNSLQTLIKRDVIRLPTFLYTQQTGIVILVLSFETE